MAELGDSEGLVSPMVVCEGTRVEEREGKVSVHIYLAAVFHTCEGKLSGWKEKLKKIREYALHVVPRDTDNGTISRWEKRSCRNPDSLYYMCTFYITHEPFILYFLHYTRTFHII